MSTSLSVPSKPNSDIRTLSSPLSKLKHFGLNYKCSLCNAWLRTLEPYGKDLPVLLEKKVVGGGRRHSRCPCCGSLDRERLLYLFLKEQTSLFTQPTKLLHIAPEKRLTKILRKHSNIDYLTADINAESSRIMIAMDVTAIQYEDNSFDAILCNHVLEHVEDDARAMAELFRVLRPDGWAILQVPISLNLETTFEDTTITTPAAREAAYGQKDHVRLYGQDYGQKLTAIGFIVKEFRWQDASEKFGELSNRYALNPSEVIYWVTKK